MTGVSVMLFLSSGSPQAAAIAFLQCLQGSSLPRFQETWPSPQKKEKVPQMVLIALLSKSWKHQKEVCITHSGQGQNSSEAVETRVVAVLDWEIWRTLEIYHES